MTDRWAGLTVTFEQPIRSDDAEAIVTLIEQIRGVASVTGVVADAEHYMAVERARNELRELLWKALNHD